MGRSIAFVSSRGGIGKSTLVSQLAAAYAHANPELTVVVIDASLHADSSAHLLGGLQEPSSEYPTAKSMADGMISALAPSKTFHGLLHALGSPAPAVSSFGRLWARGSAAPRIDPLDFAVTPATHYARGGVPSNLRLIAGGATLKGLDAAQAPSLAKSLSDAMRSAPDTVLFVIDTDAEICERPSSSIAAAAADRIAIVASSMWSDFLRLLSDPHNNIPDFLAGIPGDARKISHFVFTNLPKTRTNEYSIHGAQVLNFQPNKESVGNVEQIVSYVYERHISGPFAQYITLPTHDRVSEFTGRLASGVLCFPEGIIQNATLHATPIATMTASASSADALDMCKETLAHVATRVLG